jgi:Fe-S-cluster-containing hydrogenase component 2
MGENRKTAVIVCGDIGRGALLADAFPDGDAALRVVEGLCRRPGTLGRVLAGQGFRRLVVGLCAPPSSRAEIQAQARRVGLDALGVEVVSLRGASPEKTKMLLAAAVARARAFAGSGPEHAKVYLTSRLTRRSLLTLTLAEYRAVPSVAEETCVAEGGCTACVEACPRDALAWVDGRIVLDKETCEPCGLCVTACPRGAVVLPSTTPAQVEAEIRTLLSARPSGPRGIVFRCARAPEKETHEGWMPIALPCVAMAPPPWLLAPLLMGAGVVGVLACRPGCPMGQEETIEATVAFCRSFLRALGVREERVTLDPALDQPAPEGGRVVPLEDAFGPRGAAEVLSNLAAAYDVPDAVLTHPASPLGIVAIRPEACTGCGMCAKACPTEALTYGEGGGAVTLTFDAAACGACGQCLSPCPEARGGAIALSRTVDLARLRGGRTVLYRDATARCEACAAAIAPVTMIRRVEALLGDDFHALMPAVTRYCPKCRAAALG